MQDAFGFRLTEAEDNFSIRSYAEESHLDYLRTHPQQTAILPVIQDLGFVDEPVPVAAPPAKKRGWLNTALLVFAELMLTASVAFGGYMLWELHWTSYVAEKQVAVALEDFAKKHPTPPQPKVFVEPSHFTGDVPEIGEISHGEIFGTLHVPRWNYMRIPMAAGTSDDVLDNAYAGWYDWTQQPGQVGNFALAAHRRTYGNSFRRVDDLEVGDPIVVETADKFLVYTVSEKKIVTPDRGDVLYPVPENQEGIPTERILTMTTCHPEYDNYERYIVHSKLAYWTNKSEGKPGVIKDEDLINPTGRVDY